MIGGKRNRKKNSSWKLNHALRKNEHKEEIIIMIINTGFQSLNSSVYIGKAWKNLMLVSVSEMLASPPTIKPANNKQHGDESKPHHRSISFRIPK